MKSVVCTMYAIGEEEEVIKVTLFEFLKSISEKHERCSVWDNLDQKQGRRGHDHLLPYNQKLKSWIKKDLKSSLKYFWDHIIIETFTVNQN